MKTIRTALNTHLSQEVTTLCTCWRIERRDGAIFTFTSHDQPLVMGGRTYESQHGFMASSMSGGSDLSVDNLDINGVLISDQITEVDLRNRLFDFAKFYIFVTNWQDPVEDDMKMRRGTLGEVTLNQQSEFHSEVRGMNQSLSHNTIELFSSECRTDFCSAKCGKNIADYTHRAVVVSVEDNQNFTTSGVIDVTGSTSHGAHRFWQLRFPIAPADGEHIAFAESHFFDQQNQPIDGHKYYSSSFKDGTVILGIDFGGGHDPDRGHDGRPDTYWETNDLPPGADSSALVNQYWIIDMGSAHDVKTLSIMTSAEYLKMPSSFAVYYCDDFDHDFPSSASWAFAANFEYTFTEGGKTALWGFGSGSPDPINFPTDPGALPAPYTGMSTYDGGIVKFQTGGNAGAPMEISTFDGTTQHINLFEPMRYPIKVGDSFDISQGCDKKFETCILYNNAVNFRGEPKVPGQDALLDYPNAS